MKIKNHSQPQRHAAVKTGNQNSGHKIYTPFWLAMGYLLFVVSFSAFAQDVEADAPILPSSPVVAPEIGRYQFAIEARENSSANFYVMDTSTGMILIKSGSQWDMFTAPLSDLVFEDALAKHEREQKAAAERREKINAERRAVDKLFREGTLEEQVEAAESILVFRVLTPPTTSIVMTPSYLSSRQGDYLTGTLRMVEELKGPPVSKVVQIQSARGQSVIHPPINYPQLGATLPVTFSSSSKDGKFDRKLEEGDTFVYFVVPSESQETYFDFLFASKQQEFPERTFLQSLARKINSTCTALSSTREPSELIEDIKAIHERKE